MKIPAALVAALFAASLLSAQNQPTPNPADTPATAVTPATPKTAPATPAPAKKEVKKPEPEPKIPGLTIVRSNGTFLGLEMVEHDFKLSFYDKKKKPMVPDVSRATAHWPNQRARGDVRSVLLPEGTALVGGSKHADPPYTYIVHITLLNDEAGETKTVESFVINLGG